MATPRTDAIIAAADACPQTRVVFLIKHLVNLARELEVDRDRVVNTHKGLMQAVEQRVEVLEAFVKDLAEHGTRHDRNPTMNYDGTVFDVGTRFTQYLQSMDSAVRERAKGLLP